MKFMFLILLLFCSISVNAQENTKYINVNGTSELILPADQINFTIQIKIVDESVEESKKANDKYLNELLTLLKTSEINSKDIEVSPITIGKNYEVIEREREQKGFFTQVNVSFILKDLTKYYDLTNKLSKNNYYEIVNSNYSISDYEAQHKLAYEKALEAAKEKAAYMTKALGVKLGNVLEIDENNYWQSYATPFNTVTKVNLRESDISGNVTIRRSVRVKFSIE